MYHSITFGNKNTWTDWHLIPSSRPLFNPPKVKTNIVKIPGGDGSIDLTTALTGRPTYENRTGSFTFYVENGYKDWAVLYSEIMAYLHGQEMNAVLEDDPTYYYSGRFSVNAWKSDAQRSQIVIDYEVGPYKMYAASNPKWLWDTFNFEEDIVRDYRNLQVKGSRVVPVQGDQMSVIPTIITTASGMKVKIDNVTYSLAKGSNYNTAIVIEQGIKEWTFTGNGSVTIDVVGGKL